MLGVQKVTVKDIIDHYGYVNLTPEIDPAGSMITVPEVNRLALQLIGFFEYFEAPRVQVLGAVEKAFIDHMTPQEKVDCFRAILEKDIPCLILTHDVDMTPAVRELFVEFSTPVLFADIDVIDLVGELTRWLKVKLAPCISIHGVLMDIYGEGVLIMGESGIGKSEAALELIKRGHRLVSDDVVEIRKVSEATLIGSAPEITKHFIELRGIGIIDVKSLYGVECVKDTQQIDMVIQLEDWDKSKEYDRLGMKDNYTEFLGNKVTCHVLPIRPGRNLAIICETAAVNHRQKKMGYNAAQELCSRFQANMARNTGLQEE